MILLLCEIYRTTASSRNTQCHVFFSKKQDRTRKYPEIKFSGISQLFSSFSSCTISIIHGASTHIGLIPRYIPHGEIGKCRVSRRPLLVVNLRICNFTKFRAFSNFHVSAKFPIYTVKSVLENTDVTPLPAPPPARAAAGKLRHSKQQLLLLAVQLARAPQSPAGLRVPGVEQQSRRSSSYWASACAALAVAFAHWQTLPIIGHWQLFS